MKSRLSLGRSHVRLVKDGTAFTSKLIDGRFPDFEAVIPAGADKQIIADRDALTMPCSVPPSCPMKNTVVFGWRQLGSALKIIAHNPQHEEAVEEIEVELNFDQLAVGFNVTYLLDALTALESESVSLELKDANSSCLVAATESDLNRHVVMPLKL